ncbi:MAG TPA: hydroxyacid dehydrogenase [bacterium]|nr:hydroxyacid dehydrogenase [bacterium]
MPRKRPTVVLIEAMYHRAGEDLLREQADVRVLTGATPEMIREALGTAAAAWVRYPTRLHGEAIRNGAALLVISTSGRGTDAIDIAAATERGVAVVNNPGLGAAPVSEHAVALMLDLAKQITRSDARARQPDAWADRNRSPRIELEGRTLGLIGLGSIGSEVARKCIAAFRMQVLAYDPYVPAANAEAMGVRWVEELADVLRQSDVVSVHAELNDETRGMLGEPELRLMRREAFLVNTARGPIVQQGALIRALREGWIQGAAIDVFDPEPPPSGSPLFDLDNLILTPHVAGLTAEAVRALAVSAATQILQVLRGERPPHLLNPEVWERVARRLGRDG